MWVPYWGEFYLKTAKPFFTPEVTRDDVEIICEGLKNSPSGKILDLGCGHGRHISGVSECLRRNVIGVDFDVTSLDEAKRAGCDVIQSDVCSLPYSDGQIAGAYCWSNTAYCFKPEVREKMFREVARVLTTGGRFVCQSLAPKYALACGDAGFHAEPLENSGYVEDAYTWNGEKLHVVRTMTHGEDVQTSEISIWCPPDELVLAEMKKFGLEVAQLKHHGWQRVVTAIKA